MSRTDRGSKRTREAEVRDLNSVLDDFISKYNDDACIQSLTSTYRLDKTSDEDLVSMMRHILDEVHIQLACIN